MTMLKAYRMVMCHLQNGKPISLWSSYTKKEIPWSEELIDPKGFFVGTTADFCRDYYSGLADETETYRQILLELEIDEADLQDPEMKERWNWPVGTEAIVRRAKVLSWELYPV